VKYHHEPPLNNEYGFRKEEQDCKTGLVREQILVRGDKSEMRVKVR
jgi:hypothetical protein